MLPFLRYLHISLTSFQFAGQHQDLQIKDADNAEPLTPRYSLTANKFENSGCEQQLHLMTFGGITSKDLVLAETTILTLGEHNYFYSNTCV